MVKISSPPSNLRVLAALYRCCSPLDLFIFAVSTLAAVTQAATMPLMTVVFGEVSGKLVSPGPGFTEQLNHLTLFLVYLAALEFVACYVRAVGFNYIGERIAGSLRQQYLSSLLRRGVAHVADHTTPGDVMSRISTDADLVQDGVSEKIARAIFAPASLVAGFGIGFARSWRLTLVLSPALVAVAAAAAGCATGAQHFGMRAAAPQAAAATLAHEALVGVRAVVACGCQQKFAERYAALAERAMEPAVRVRACVALMAAAITTINSLTYALGFWQGARLVAADGSGLSGTLTTLLSVLYATTPLGLVGPSVQALSVGMAAASRILDAADHQPGGGDDADSSIGAPESVRGEITLQGVTFSYASRPGVPVLHNISFAVPAGLTTALVGSSGSGKSSILGLIERFYEPTAGTVSLDGRPLAGLSRRWLRGQMGLVSQDPVLFDATVFDNIAYGLTGTGAETADATAKWDMVVQAAKTANAHRFIVALPTDTPRASESEACGSPRQRIAIARAIVANPRVLLLDEATSALDAVSERAVQTALGAAMRGRTCLIIAHRLSTVHDADWVIVLDCGRVAEQGRPVDLRARGGLFSRLLQAQRLDYAEAGAGGEGGEGGKGDAGEDVMVTQVAADGSEEGEGGERDAVVTQMAAEGPRLSLHAAVAFAARFNRPDRALLAAGVASSVVAGCAATAQSFLFARAVVMLPRGRGGGAGFWSAMLVALAGVQLVTWTALGLAFATCAERLLLRARRAVFAHTLRQDAVFFDRNPASMLACLLAASTADLAGASGPSLSAVVTGLSTMVSGVALAVAVGWKLGLACTATVPIILAGGRLRMVFMAQQAEASRQSYAAATAYACEAVAAITAVAALRMESRVLVSFSTRLNATARRNTRALARSALLYAFSQAAVYCCFALGVWYGGMLIARREYSATQFFVCFTAVVFGAQSAGAVFSLATDLTRAQAAAAALKAVVDRIPAIDVWDRSSTPADGACGALRARQLTFSYSSQAALSDVDFEIRPGTTVAFVGPSGSGKSTVVALLMRLYDPDGGAFDLDGQDIRALNVVSYRRNFALVSQETCLFSGSIRDNITLAAADDAQVPDEAVEQACRDAAIYDFVVSLPDGLNTPVGSNGLGLSGGQRQRVAIARAMLAGARVLLLDEATSALDTESEQAVQAAINRATSGRTTVAVAQRLSTIRHADCIYVFEQGRIVERGNHAELIARDGLYATMVCLQNQ